jgi:membrane-associated protease RseP (regulator of RpoE activity)
MALEDLFVQCRRGVLRDVEVLRGTLRPDLEPDDPRVVSALARWPGTRFTERTPYGGEVMLVRRARLRPAERWWLHVLLFSLTLASTTLCGALVAGMDPPVRTLSILGTRMDVPAGVSAAGLLAGLWFSLPLCATLLAHEAGHYLAARVHGLDVSPPYFIPAPYAVSLLGTFGAFIRLRTPLLNRVMLLDVGAAGPLAGMAVALPATVAGLAMSHPMAGLPPVPGMRFVVFWMGRPFLPLGGSLLFDAVASAWGSPHGLVALHPLAVAGWFGLFFTMLNLLPAGQLDGGHVLYALFGRWQQAVGAVAVAVLLALGFGWPGWWFWAAVILVLGRGRVGHPPVLDDTFRVRGWRRAAGWACIAVAVLTFIRVPL